MFGHILLSNWYAVYSYPPTKLQIHGDEKKGETANLALLKKIILIHIIFSPSDSLQDNLYA